MKTSLGYIKNNYMDKLNNECKLVINSIIKQLNKDNYDLDILNQALNIIVKDIWKSEITNISSYNPDDNFSFICSNNRFIDPKYQAILITKNELNKVNDYADYQIGFICGYNNNILYITENDDIMSVDNDDMSNLKTPKQLEQEFINFKVCNRIALDGYITKIEAVYIINDGNIDKYNSAVNIANMYKLPLIELKKEKI